MATIKNNRCFECGKIFCCSDCRDAHVKKKHPSRGVDCSLCHSQLLAVKHFDDQEFLYHVFFNHLPLYCVLCGSKFDNCEDLQSIGKCDRHRVESRAARQQRHQQTGQRNIFSPDTPLSLNKTPCGSSTLSRERRGDSTFDDNRSGHFESVISPPEFTRHTSTPMHVNATGAKANLVYKIPKSPIYSLKTPKTAGQAASKESLMSDKENDSPESVTSYKDSEDSSCNESNYHSFVSRSSRSSLQSLRSVLLSKSGVRSEISRYSARNNNSSGSSSSSINGRKMLDAMEELDENARNDTEAESFAERGSPVGTTAEEAREEQRRDSIKRVRFSDEFQMKTEMETLATGGDVDATENEEFYEARQSISEMTMAVVDKLSLSSARIDDENQKNFEAEKKKEDRDVASLKTSDIHDSKVINETSASRVIMMLVVEKNGDISGNDLAPLIDSSLKKLVSTSADNLGNSIDRSKRENDEVRPGTSVLSVDSYMSVSTVECYKTANSTIDSSPESTESSGAGGSTGGIFAAVAHAMKAAFKNFSSARLSKNAAREALSDGASIPSTISESGGASSSVLTGLASALASKTPKRSRDVDELTLSQSSERSVDSYNDVTSPVPKRPRGWSKIRGRDPIARMRNNLVASPRGISSETQCFQQGLLSVGDTILNLPSRAHQSTQTD